MKLIDLMPVTAGLALLAGSDTQPFPPATTAIVPAASPWTSYDGAGIVPEFDLELWAGSATTAGVAIAVTNAELFAGVLRAFTIPTQNITSVAGNVITKNGHGLLTGDGPLFLAGALPAPLDPAAGVFAVRLGPNTFSVATTRENALAGTVIVLTTTGSGTIAIVGDATTQRLYWTSLGKLGDAADGAVSLDVARGYRKTFAHRSRSYCYGLVATLDTGRISAALYPISDRN